MALDIEHGAGGLWDVHTWTPPVGDPIDLNVQDDDPQIRIDSITGLHNLPDHENPTAPRAARVGETLYPAGHRGKTVVYEGELRATTVPLMRETRALLVAAFAHPQARGYMDITPHEDVGGPAGRFNAWPLSLSIDEQQKSRYFRREFSLALRLDDPRIYFPTLAVDETDTTAVTVTNDGTAPADPVVTVTGVSAGTVSINNGTHQLDFVSPGAGDLVIDFAARRATISDNPVPIVWMTSTWWNQFVPGIAPGATVVIAQGGGTGVTVEFTPSVWA